MYPEVLPHNKICYWRDIDHVKEQLFMKTIVVSYGETETNVISYDSLMTLVRHIDTYKVSLYLLWKRVVPVLINNQFHSLVSRLSVWAYTEEKNTFPVINAYWVHAD